MKKWDYGQWISGFAVITGIIIEIIYKADIGFIFITGGALAWGIFTKLKGR